MKARSCWSFRSLKRSSTSRTSRSQNTDSPPDFSDCASTEKCRRLPPRKATGAGIVLARERKKASTKGGKVMMICSSPRSLLLAGAFIGAFACAAAAQQPASPPAAAAPAAAAPLPPGSPLIGRPESNQAAAKLAPVAPPPIAAAADKLPLAKLKVPAGFNIEVYAAGIANARSLALGDNGTVFVDSRRIDKVHAIVDKDGKRTVKVLASGLYRPNGV